MWPSVKIFPSTCLAELREDGHYHYGLAFDLPPGVAINSVRICTGFENTHTPRWGTVRQWSIERPWSDRTPRRWMLLIPRSWLLSNNFLGTIVRPDRQVSFQRERELKCRFWLEIDPNGVNLEPTPDPNAAVQAVAEALTGSVKTTFVIGSIPSRVEAGLPSVADFKAYLLSASRRHLPVHVQAELYDLDVQARLRDVPFEALFSVAQEYQTVPLLELLRVFQFGLPGPTHKFFAQLLALYQQADIVTTNFDLLFEDSGISTVVYREDDFAGNRQARLWKIHGTVGADDPRMDSVVCTIEDTARGLSPKKRSFLRKITSSRQLVFVAYGANDLDLFPVLADAEWTYKPVWVLRPRQGEEAWTQYRTDRQQHRALSLTEASGGVAYVDGYQSFIMDLANRIGLSYVPNSAPVPLLSDVALRFEAWARSLESDRLRAFWADLLVHVGHGRAALRVAGPPEHSRADALSVSLARAQFQTGQYRCAIRSFSHALASARRTGDAVKTAFILSNIGECHGLRYEALRGWWYSWHALRLARRVHDAKAEGWTALRIALGVIKMHGWGTKAARIVGARGLASLVLLPMQRTAAAMLRGAVELLQALGDEYGSQSARRILEKLGTFLEPERAYSRNAEIARRLTAIGREREVEDVYREQVKCLLSLPATARVELGGEEFSSVEAARLLSRYCFTHALTTDGWPDVAKAARDLVALSEEVRERRTWYGWIRQAAGRAQFGLFGTLLLLGARWAVWRGRPRRTT